MDWNTWKCHCSSLGKLMTEPKAGEKGALSQTAKSYLKEVYGEFKYNRREDFSSRYTEKGNLVEEECITMLSRLDKELYKKNTERVENEFLTGIPDIFKGEQIRAAEYIIDNKAPWSLRTFLTVIDTKLDRDYWSQIQGYFDLTGASKGEVSYCLADCPENILMEEKMKLLNRMVSRLEAVTEFSPAYMEAAAELEYMHRFEDIPLEERRVKFEVERDQSFIDAVHEKVKVARRYLADFEKIHLNGKKSPAPALDVSSIKLTKIKKQDDLLSVE
jgi:hypothetical protein